MRSEATNSSSNSPYATQSLNDSSSSGHRHSRRATVPGISVSHGNDDYNQQQQQTPKSKESFLSRSPLIKNAKKNLKR